VKGKEGNSQRRPISGLALMFLYFSKNAKFLIIIGTFLTAIGFIVVSYFGSIVVRKDKPGYF
jgi:hypothetical protein